MATPIFLIDDDGLYLVDESGLPLLSEEEQGAVSGVMALVVENVSPGFSVVDAGPGMNAQNAGPDVIVGQAR